MMQGNRRETHGAASRTSDGRVRTAVAPGRYRGTVQPLIPLAGRFITGRTIYVDGGRTVAWSGCASPGASLPGSSSR